MAGDVVFVGCKMPNGVELNLDRYEVLNQEQGTVRLVKSKVAPVTLKGNSVKFGAPDLSIYGYVYTPVPKEFWEEWLKHHAESSLLADGFIKPAASMNHAQGIAREHEKERGQFPRLTENDPRIKSLGVEKFDPKAA